MGKRGMQKGGGKSGAGGGKGGGRARGGGQNPAPRDVRPHKRKRAEQPATTQERFPRERRRAVDGKPVPVATPKSAREDVAAILAFYALEPEFEPMLLEQAEAVAAWDIAEEIGERLDLREARSFTIDGADARDFDDAVSVEPLADCGCRLGVHIADVSWYVRPGTVLDTQAQARATSVYFPDRVLPMLPEAISNGCCSLLPGEDRLTLSVIAECDAEGNVVTAKVERTVIRSHARLVYDDVNLLLQGDAAQVARYGDLLPDLQRMAALAAKLRAARYARGGLDFDVDEASIVADDDGEPVCILPRPRGAAERMIEDFMLLANEAVARHAKQRKLPCLYRVHEPMDADKALSLAAFLRGLGLHLRGAHSGVTPQALQKVLREAEAMPEYPIVAQLALRAMQKAHYDAEPLGHFGLATADYCHFTAPIRRYPDLFVHRMIAAEATGELRFLERAMRANAPALAAHTSQRERNAMEAERAVEKMMMARYMRGHIGEAYDGLIVSVVEWGMYVALPSTVEGLVHVRTLPGYWKLNHEQHCLIAEGTGAMYRLGQAVRVRVDSVDVGTRQIDFVIEE